MDTVSTKSLAEHLTKLATMLSADAMKLSALGVESHRNLASEAAALKILAERLWLTAGEVQLADLALEKEMRLDRDRRTLQGSMSYHARPVPARPPLEKERFKAAPRPPAGSSGLQVP